MDGAGVAAAAALGYLFGSFPSADLASGVAGRGTVDLRTAGSGNPGATNAAAVLGKRWGVAVLVVDLLKGVLAVVVGRELGGDAGAYAAAITVIAGHILPPWSRFRGGKGVATSAGVCLALFPVYFPIYIGIAAVVAITTRSPEMVALVSAPMFIAAAIVWWAASWPNAWGPEPAFGLVAYGVIASIMILTKFERSRSVAEPA